MSAILDYMRLCRLCLVKDKVNVPIFGETSDVRQIFLKISACLPVKVSQDDNLPKNICDTCLYKVDLLYQFWNTTVNAEKQLIQWLSEIGVDVNIKNSSPPPLRMMPQSHAHPHSMTETIILKEERLDPETRSVENEENFQIENQQYNEYEMPYQPQVNMTVGAPTDFTQPLETPAEEDVKVPQEKSQPTQPTPAKRRGRPPKQKTPPSAKKATPAAIKAVATPPPAPPPIITNSKRRSSAAAAAAAVAAAAADVSSDESDIDDRLGADDTDDEDMDITVAKEEADSEDEEYVDNPESLEPTTFVGVPSTSACDSDQPGPSGLGGGSTTGKTSSALPANAANESGITSEQPSQEPFQIDSKTNQFCTQCNLQFQSHAEYILHRRVHRKQPILLCKYCGKKFIQLIQLRQHEYHHERILIACEICNKKFGNVYKHKRRQHSKTFPHQCNKCEKLYRTKEELSEHTEEIHSGKRHSCKVCKKEYSNARFFKIHLKSHELDDREFKCIVCDNVYHMAKSLRKHMQTDHGTTKSVSCNICQKVLSSFSSLREHKMRHAGKKPFTCEICSKKFVTIKQLRVHLRIHTGEKPFKCLDCGRCFSQTNCLKIHRRLHTGERPFKCKNCNKTFPSKTSLKAHLKIHDNKVVKRKYYCNICGKDFSSTTKVTYHKESEHLGIRYPCTICEKVFRSSYYLSRHVKTHDGNYKPPEFSCTKCDRVFETKRSLKRHVGTVHENVAPAFMCDICGKRVASPESLRDHKSTHTGSKPFKCTYCGKSFIKQNNLIVHIRTHTQEKPYSCEECGKSFTQIGTLKLHRRLHSGERPFMCQVCDKRYISKSALKLHIGSHY